MSNVRFYKNTKAILDNIEISDGQILYATDTKEHFLDHNSERIKFTPDIPKTPATTDDIQEGATNHYDKTVSLTAGEGINISGTYPDFTIANTNQSGSEGLPANAFYTSSSYCVLCGNVDSNNKPKLFNEDYSVFVSEQTPLVVAFADGFTKVFTSIANADELLPPVLSNDGNNADISISSYVVLDEDGNIDIWQKSKTYYLIADCVVLPNPDEYGILIDISGQCPISKVWDKTKSQFVPKRVYVLGEHTIQRQNGIVTSKAITYNYRQNGFNDPAANKIISYSTAISSNIVQLDNLHSYYNLGSFSQNTTLTIKKPIDVQRLMPPNPFVQEFTLVLETTAENIEISFIDQYDLPISLCGNKAGAAGAGTYHLKLYCDSSGNIFGETKYFVYDSSSGPPANTEPGYVPVDPEPFDPFG